MIYMHVDICLTQLTLPQFSEIENFNLIFLQQSPLKPQAPAVDTYVRTSEEL